MVSNEVDGVESGMGGVAACDGAFLLQSPHVSLVLLTSFDIPGQYTMARARRSMLDLS